MNVLGKFPIIYCCNMVQMKVGGLIHRTIFFVAMDLIRILERLQVEATYVLVLLWKAKHHRIAF